MDLPSASWVNLALQIPLALVIVFLVVISMKYLKEIAGAVLAFMERQGAAVLLFMEKQAEINRSFIEQQQEVHNQSIVKQQEVHSQSIARLAEEIKSNRTDMVRELANLTQRVDSVIDKAMILERLLPPSEKKTK